MWSLDMSLEVVQPTYTLIKCVSNSPISGTRQLCCSLVSCGYNPLTLISSKVQSLLLHKYHSTPIEHQMQLCFFSRWIRLCEKAKKAQPICAISIACSQSIQEALPGQTPMKSKLTCLGTAFSQKLHQYLQNSCTDQPPQFRGFIWMAFGLRNLKTRSISPQSCETPIQRQKSNSFPYKAESSQSLGLSSCLTRRDPKANFM